jgi:hypothetical protein
MMAKKNVSVGPSGTGRWNMNVGGKVKSSHQKQSTAIEKAKPIAKKLATDLTIRGRDGKIRSKDSYGPDPNPPKDTEH